MVEKLYPLTHEQQALWVDWKLGGETSSFNTCVQIQLDGVIDPARFCQEAKNVVDYFDMLRCYFVEGNNGEANLTFSEQSYDFEFIDLSKPNPQYPYTIEQLLDEKRDAHIDLLSFPLIRAALIKASETRFFFTGVVPHIISDGASALFFLQALSTCYNHGFDGLKKSFDDSKKSWADYLDLKKVLYDEAKNTSAKEYWQQNLKNASHKTSVSRKPTSLSLEGKRFCFKPEHSILKPAKKLAFANRTSIFSVIGAFFSGFLNQYYQCTNFTIGYPVNLRPAGFKHAFGMFVNFIPLNMSVEGNMPFEALVKHVHKVRRQDKNAQFFPALDIVKAKREIEADFDGQLFNLSMVETISRLQNLSIDGIHSVALDNEEIKVENDLSLIYEISEEGITFWFEYRQALFTDETIVRMSQHFLRFVSQVLANPEITLNQTHFLCETEQQNILIDHNKTTAPFENLKLHQFFERQAHTHPTQAALIKGAETLTYQKLNQQANQLAHQLIAQGLKPNQAVAIITQRSFEQFIAMLGILKAGGAYVPIETENPQQRIEDILQEADCAMICCSDAQQVVVRTSFNRDVVLLDSIDSKLISNPNINEGQLAYIVFTSGSTGKPKGVVVSHHALAPRITDLCKRFELHPGDKVLHNTRFSFDVSIAEMYWPLASGATLVLADSKLTVDSRYLCNLINAENIKACCFVPSALSVLLNHAEEGLPKLEYMLSCGEALALDTVKQYYEVASGKLYNLYGPSETVIYTTCILCDANDSEVSIGQALENTTLYVLNDALSPQPLGVTGELYIGGACIADGYVNRPDLTDERFIPNPFGDGLIYKTGDLVYWREDLQMMFLGRNDSQIKLRGFRIELEEIGAKLRQYATVVDAAASLFQHKNLVGYYVGKPTKPQDIIDYLGQSLPCYMVPQQFVNLDSIPRLASGKVNYKSLPAPDIVTLIKSDKQIKPKSKIEKKVAVVWAEILKIPLKTIGVNNDFFSLGGDSLLLMQLSCTLEKIDLYIQPHELFIHRNIRSIIENSQTGISGSQSKPVFGDFLLLPRQVKFFQDGFNNPHHWHRNVLVKLKINMPVLFIERAFNALITHHDGLRSSFSETEGQYSAFIEPTLKFKVAKYTLHKTEPLEQISTELNRINAEITLKNAPLIRVIYFKGRDNYLTLCMHHLLFDMRSLQILFEDLFQIFTQLAANKNIQLAPKTASLPEWRHALEDYIQQMPLSAEIPFWQSQLSVQNPSYQSQAPESVLKHSSFSLSKELSQSLLQSGYAIHHSLLAALAQSFKTLRNDDYLVLNTCSHGREMIQPKLSLNRSIGWFNTVFPLAVNLNGENILDNVKRLYAQLNKNGFHYNLLRFIQKQPEITALPEPGIFFNYVSKIDSKIPYNVTGEFIKLPKEVQYSDPNNRSCYSLYIEAGIVDGVIEFVMKYVPDVFTTDEIVRLQQGTEAALNY